MAESLQVRQFRKDDCLSYLITDPQTRETCLVDPRTDLLESYREHVGHHRLIVTSVVDTRLHADHLSAGKMAATEWRCELLLSEKTSSARKARKVADGETVRLGTQTLKILLAPGVSQDALVLVGPTFLISGDALWIGTSENAFQPGSDLETALRSALRLASLDSGLLVYPAHDHGGLLFSTVAVEKAKNPLLLARGASALAETHSNGTPHHDEDCQARLEFNSKDEAGVQDARVQLRMGDYGGSPRKADLGSASTISVEKFKRKIEERPAGTEFIDVREASEFAAGHIPGMRNIVLSDLGAEMDRLAKAKRVYVSCLSGMRSALAAKTLSYIGLKDVVVVNGGLQAWNHSGFPVTEKEVD